MKKRMNKGFYILILFTLSFSSACTAQLGVTAGIQASSFKFVEKATNYGDDYTELGYGYTIGVVYNSFLDVDEWFSFKISPTYSVAQFKISEMPFKVNSFILPVDFVIHFGDSEGMFLKAGAAVERFIGGTAGGMDLNFGNSEEDFMKPMGVKLSIGGGVKSNNVMFGLHYDHQVNNTYSGKENMLMALDNIRVQLIFFLPEI